MPVDVHALVADLDADDVLRRRRALARLLTVVEDGARDALPEVVGLLHPRTGEARVLGVTGPPGVGKSTLTNALAAALRARDRTVAVVAVDPSSPFSGGALLGDRVRMQGHHADDGVFIRSMAARGHLGGLAFATPLAVTVFDAAGFDDVVVETVGVGQSEVEVAASADTTIVASAPGMGDGVQAAKAGILEVADVLVVNKADHSGAGRLASELRGMVELSHETGADGGGWLPPIVRTVAVREEGIDELLAAIDAHTRAVAEEGELTVRRRRRAAHTVREVALERLRARLSRLGGEQQLLDRLAAAVERRELDPYGAAERLLAALDDVTDGGDVGAGGELGVVGASGAAGDASA